MNGRWGSGKTYFLNRLREKSKKYKYIEMDFWGEEISEKNFTLIAKKLKPVCFFYYKLAYPTIVIIISAVITFLSYLFTDDLFTTSVFTNNMVIIFFFFLIVALLLQFKDYFSSPDILEKRSKNLIRNFSDKNKIIIIDDFDRISSQDRQNLYAIINLLKSDQNKIIVVGDIIQIDKDIRDGFVRKIIDYRYDIDNLHSTQYLYSKIEDKLRKIEVDTSSIEMELLKSDFINEKRTYRDYEQFSELIDDHISNIKYINSNEKIYLLYLYHFYYEVYSKVILFIDRYRISFLEVLKSYKSTEDEKNENFMEELQKDYQLNGLLHPFINKKDVNAPSLFDGNHDLYIVGNGKNFHNIKLVLEQSKVLSAESFKEVTELDSQSQALFRTKVSKLIVMRQDDKKLLIGYLDDIVNLLFDNNQYNEDTDFNNLIAATLYDLKKFLITTSEFKEWYKHKADTIGLNKLFFLKVKFDRENNVLTDEEYESIVQPKDIIFNDEPFYGTLHLLKNYDEKRFNELIRDIIGSDDEKFYGKTKSRLLSVVIRNGEEEIQMVHETIITSSKLKAEFLTRIKKIEPTQLREELLLYYNNAIDYSEFSLI
ncbi:hypothetical protein CFN03_03805 [Salinicoccus roseus]|uniref:KAP NTPase domain-containing protein n=1 Tax=Salinicoccus roseus TaxID=45670 RepID=A0A265EA10_9STAP|nr:P-loop NTPase fold protein [Salinicoccus roseus]OZT78414.1 hypothetical protein CFN03_03805 [Salinicoccus roseus]